MAKKKCEACKAGNHKGCSKKSKTALSGQSVWVCCCRRVTGQAGK